MATKHDVIRANAEHPDWIAREIAAHLGCLPEYVNVAARRAGLRLPKVSDDMARHAALRTTIHQLGTAAHSVGMTLADIESWHRTRSRGLL